MRPSANDTRQVEGVGRVWLTLATAALAGPVGMLGAPASAQAAAPEATVSVIVQYDPDSSARAENAVTAAGGRLLKRFEVIDGFAASVGANRVPALRAMPGVRSITPDASVRLSGDSGDWDKTTESSTSSGRTSWNDRSDEFGDNPLSQIATTIGVDDLQPRRAVSARDKPTGKGIGVALIDSGVAPVTGLNGPGKVINGPDLSFESQAPNLRHLDTFGHGTHMAGIIAGDDPGNSSDDFSGVAPGATLINLKVASADGATDVSQVIAAIDWVVTHRNDPGLNIRVLNLSFGTDSVQDARLDPLSYAVEAAWNKGIVVVVAVGNEGFKQTRVSMPAANPYVIAVGSSDGRGTPTRSDDIVADFSTRGNSTRGPDLVAPGKSVVSLRNPGSFIDEHYPGGLVPGDSEKRFFRGSGTSQATAVTSGAVALLLQQRPQLRPDQVKRLLTSTATPMPKADPIGRGAGLLNVAAAADAHPSSAVQKHPPALGTGSLELSRGTAHVADPTTGEVLQGEQDIMGQAWDPATWTVACAAGTAWSDGTWNSRTWSGSAWTGSSWASLTWSTTAWTGTNWAGRTWSSRTWSDAEWTSAGWSSRTWSSRTWSSRTWSGGYWS
jgi:serine protease AprX